MIVQGACAALSIACSLIALDTDRDGCLWAGRGFAVAALAIWIL